MLVDFGELSEDGDVRYDLCIVGSGAAGLAVASTFWDGRRAVCIVESGAASPQQRYQSLNRAECVGLDYDCVESRCRALGGTLHMWSGTCAPLDPIDFRPRAWVPRSGWPIDRAALQPHYAEAATFFGAPETMGVFDALPDACERQLDRMSVPTPEFDRKPFLLLHAHVAAHVGRLRKKVAAAGNVHCIVDATVVDIAERDGGAVDHIVLRSMRGDSTRKVRAKAFVICAGGLETPRLLLASRQRRETGIGNARGLVGRYFMDHPRIRSTAFPLPRRMQAPILTQARNGSVGLRSGFTVTESLQEKLELANHCFFLNPVSVDLEAKAVRSLETVRRAEPGDNRAEAFSRARVGVMRLARRGWRAMPARLRLAFESGLSMRTFKQLSVVTKIEQVPNPASAITLSTETDRFGVPKLRLQWRLDDVDRAGIARYHDLIGSAFHRHGHATEELSFLGPGGDYIVQDTAHPMGATRMSDDPQWGVVDPNLKVFGVPNLFLCSSSVFPSGGNANPTFTIVALAKRLGHHLETQLAAGRL